MHNEVKKHKQTLCNISNNSNQEIRNGGLVNSGDRRNQAFYLTNYPDLSGQCTSTIFIDMLHTDVECQSRMLVSDVYEFRR